MSRSLWILAMARVRFANSCRKIPRRSTNGQHWTRETYPLLYRSVSSFLATLFFWNRCISNPADASSQEGTKSAPMQSEITHIL